ncbi:hypothetical protein MKZ38_000276 [Zalerion maritima]|uniref:Uncharacterized protein n=1 Tax=Zalerion maritima TaxID=339359 RepID=A0AAD5RJA0_9PEZI|nr:hypothetical protein MKZ38_000276 [Zalerion maritima]
MKLGGHFTGTLFKDEMAKKGKRPLAHALIRFHAVWTSSRALNGPKMVTILSMVVRKQILKVHNNVGILARSTVISVFVLAALFDSVDAAEYLLSVNRNLHS